MVPCGTPCSWARSKRKKLPVSWPSNFSVGEPPGMYGRMLEIVPEA